MAEDSPVKKIKIPRVDRKLLAKRAKKVESATIKHAHKFIIKRWDNVLEVRKNVIAWVLLVCSLIGATGIQLMWLQGSYSTDAYSTDGTYAEAVLGPIDTLNPLYSNTSAEQSVSSLLFSKLLKYDRFGKLNYDLVKKIEISNENKTYRIFIRDDAKWTDGQKLDVDDIVFTLGLIKNNSARTVISGWDNIEVKKIDELSIEFNLKSPYAAFEHALVFPVLPEHILGDVPASSVLENQFSQNPVGSGPFKFNFIQNDNSIYGHKTIHMIRNQDYYLGFTKLARFQLHVFNNNEEILKALDANMVNAAADLNPSDIEFVNKDRYIVRKNSINSGVFALINTRSAVMSDLNVRKALRLATSTESIRSVIGMNAKPLDLPLIDGQVGGSLPSVEQYNESLAIKTLEDSGWVFNSDGKRFKADKQLKISVVTVKGSELEDVLEQVAFQWRAVGFEVDVKVVNPNDLASNDAQEILQTRNYDVFIHQLNIGADPDVYAYWHSSQAVSTGQNFSNYSDVVSDAALATARVRLESDIRNTKYLAFVKQWVNDIPAIGLYQSTVQYVYSDKVVTYAEGNNLISATDRYSDILNWSAGKSTVYKTP